MLGALVDNQLLKYHLFVLYDLCLAYAIDIIGYAYVCIAYNIYGTYTQTISGWECPWNDEWCY